MMEKLIRDAKIKGDKRAIPITVECPLLDESKRCWSLEVAEPCGA
jgi:hypothetical protein